MKYATFLSLATLLASASAWSVTDYPYIDDCEVDSDGEYWAYMGDDNKCHNFGPGDGTASCRHFSSGGSDWTDDCDDEINTSGSVRLRYNNCRLFDHPDCKGLSKTGGDLDCVSGAFQSFACDLS